jgi:hypothetical protein
MTGDRQKLRHPRPIVNLEARRTFGICCSAQTANRRMHGTSNRLDETIHLAMRRWKLAMDCSPEAELHICGI